MPEKSASSMSRRISVVPTPARGTPWRCTRNLGDPRKHRREDMGERAAHPATVPDTSATHRCPSSQRVSSSDLVGVTVSNVARRVAIPSE